MVTAGLASLTPVVLAERNLTFPKELFNSFVELKNLIQSTIYPPKVESVEESRYVDQIDFAADIEISEHNQTFAQFETGRFLRTHQRIETRHVGAATGRTADVTADADRPDQIDRVVVIAGSGTGSPAIVMFEDLHQRRRVNLCRILDGQFTECVPYFRLHSIDFQLFAIINKSKMFDWLLRVWILPRILPPPHCGRSCYPRSLPFKKEKKELITIDWLDNG